MGQTARGEDPHDRLPLDRGQRPTQGKLQGSSAAFRQEGVTVSPFSSPLQLKDVLETIDTELSSTSLTAAQLSKSKVFLGVSAQRKVVACAVVQRIDSAYQAVSAPPALGNGEGEATPAKADLVRFGEEDQGAIFCLCVGFRTSSPYAQDDLTKSCLSGCSPDLLPTLLGVQRIWTSNASRRLGLASRLLDFVAAKYVYGSPIPLERRREDVAFSQPTGKGQKLARTWTGSDAIRVFVD